jgi:hypothetical protein
MCTRYERQWIRLPFKFREPGYSWHNCKHPQGYMEQKSIKQHSQLDSNHDFSFVARCLFSVVCVQSYSFIQFTSAIDRTEQTH